MIGWSFGLFFRNDGADGIPAGSSGMTAAIAVWTSTVALSMSRSRSNCRVMLVLPDPLPVTAIPQDGNPNAAHGTLTFVDNAVDTTTDTIKLKATFDNSDRRLWPGQFARVTLRLATLPHAVVVSSQAVQTGQDGQYVFVVKADSTVEQRPVVTAQRFDQDVVVEKGLRPGEVVVTEGQLRLEPGSRVTTDLNAPAGGGGRGRGSEAGLHSAAVPEGT